MKNANPVSSGLRAAGALLLALLAAGCGAGKAAATAPVPKTVFDHFTVNVGSHPMSLMFAVVQQEKERGLMQRPDLGKDEGMIFVEEAPQRENYWMKNTPESLDIAFVDRQGVIEEIYPLFPFDLRTVSSRSDRLQFAVETRQGWFDANGVHTGDSIDMQAVAAALKERGFDPVRFGIK